MYLLQSEFKAISVLKTLHDLSSSLSEVGKNRGAETTKGRIEICAEKKKLEREI